MRQNHPVPGRRLIFVLVILLVTLSVLSASRDISRRGPASQTAPTTTEPARTAPAARKPPRERPTETIQRSLPSSRPVRLRLGERVILRTRTERPDIIAIDQLGLRAPTGPGTPGALDFVAADPGTFRVTLAISGRKLGEISVRR